MEEISAEAENMNLASTVRRLATQVQQIQNTLNRQSGTIPTIRTRLSLDDGEGSGDEGSETKRNVKSRHSTRDSCPIVVVLCWLLYNRFRNFWNDWV